MNSIREFRAQAIEPHKPKKPTLIERIIKAIRGD
jgi:hypothetical protein